MSVKSGSERLQYPPTPQSLSMDAPTANICYEQLTLDTVSGSLVQAGQLYSADFLQDQSSISAQSKCIQQK